MCMFKARTSYFLVKYNNEDKADIESAMGTFFSSELNHWKQYYHMEDAEIMEESVFKSTYPTHYKDLFVQNWTTFIDSFLHKLLWLDYDKEVYFDDLDLSFTSNWFRIDQNPKNGELIFHHPLYADQNQVKRLIAELQEYIGDSMILRIEFPSYLSMLDNK